MGEGSGGSGWVENVDPASGEKMWTNSKTGEISLEDPSNREKAVEEMSFDEKRAYEAKQAFLAKKKKGAEGKKGGGRVGGGGRGRR